MHAIGRRVYGFCAAPFRGLVECASRAILVVECGPGRRSSGSRVGLMPTGITVPAAQVRAILDAAVDRGAVAGELCRSVGVDSATLDEADARLPLEAAIGMYETAARVVRDDSFGLHGAERSDWYAFDPLGYALSTKANVKRAVEELAPTIAMMYATRIEMVLAGDEARLTYALAEEPSRLSRHRSEAFMARILRLIRIGLGRNVEARWVSNRSSGLTPNTRLTTTVFSFPLIADATPDPQAVSLRTFPIRRIALPSSRAAVRSTGSPDAKLVHPARRRKHARPPGRPFAGRASLARAPSDASRWSETSVSKPPLAS